MSELTKEDVWRTFAERDRRLDDRFQETDRRLDQRFQEVAERFQETDRRFREIEQMLRETKRRLDQRFRETNQNFRETDKEFGRLEGIFTGPWGKLVEALSARSALRLFRERGIEITQIFREVETTRNDSHIKIDVLLLNTHEAVVIEVKTTLKAEDVREFMEQLKQFTFFFPRYKGMIIYGGVAAIHIEEDADKFAYRQGLFVLTGSGEGLITMLNSPDFKPKDFGKAEG
ncbi:DUF3782 domain-containing protein [Dehalococcoidia bacterium]|nr:DUF3782 domain-containing protein [Dehalococcoidia bacterium]